VDRGVRADLLAAYRSLDAYPEVPGTLERLRRAGLRTAILSNGDTAMLDAAVRAAGLETHLDAVLSVDPAGTFKTSARAYALAPERLGVARERIAFLSSNRWDIAGAAAYGFLPIWVDRSGQPDEYPDLAPVRVIASLDGLLA
jgi:2-haloacid dehalogenase